MVRLSELEYIDQIRGATGNGFSYDQFYVNNVENKRVLNGVIFLRHGHLSFKYEDI